MITEGRSIVSRLSRNLSLTLVLAVVVAAAGGTLVWSQRPDGIAEGRAGSSITLTKLANNPGVGLGAGAEQAAVDWARSQLGSTAYEGSCEVFVENAYGTRYQYTTAWNAAMALGLHSDPIIAAPIGALMFFAPDWTNQWDGHVGLSLGGGSMISGLAHVEITNVQTSSYWTRLYRGWAPPPSSWPGRAPVPPSNPPSQQYAINLAVHGSGTVSSNPSRLQCGHDSGCSAQFLAGSQVTLTASPDSAASFSGWGQRCSGTSLTCVITMNRNTDVQASFRAQQSEFTLHVSVSGDVSGTVISHPPGIRCGSGGSQCAADFSSGSSVVLQPSSAAGAGITWHGDCSGSNSNCQLILDSAKSVTAAFVAAAAGTSKPSLPGDVTATPLDQTNIRVTWSDNSSNEQGFMLTNGDQFWQLATNITSFTKSELSPGTYMCFQLYAFNGAGNSEWSDFGCTTTSTAFTGGSVSVDIAPSAWDTSETFWSGNGPAYESNPDTALGATHTHAYGSSTGQFSYHFHLESTPSGAVEVAARLSSEFPWYSGPSDGYSDVTLIVDGKTVGTQRVISDDGSGRTYTWRMAGDSLRDGDNTITFSVSTGAQYRNGLCIYFKGLAPGQVDAPITVRSA